MFQKKLLNHQIGKLKRSIVGIFSNFEFRALDLKNQRGAIGILTTLVLGGVLIMSAITAVLTGISSRANTFVLGQSESVFISLEGCIEDTLIRLNRDNAYLGGNFSMNGVNCSVSIEGIDDNRNVTVSGFKNNITRDVLLEVQLAPTFGIMNWTD